MKEIKLNSPYAWFLAARPKTLTGAIIPVLLGSALAFSDGEFKTPPALLCALFACGMQIAANFINDLFDFQKGTDRKDRLGPPRACAEGWITPGAMKLGIGCALLLSCLAGLALLFIVWGQLPHGGWELVVLGVVCILFAFLYTTLLSYLGWGDVLVLVFFGFVPVCGTYYVQAYTLNMDVLVLSLVSGLAIDTLLMVNNYRDREQDAVSGKCTLVVRYGRKFGENMYLGLGIAATLLRLPLHARPDVAQDGEHPQRQRAEPYPGRNFTQHAIPGHTAGRSTGCINAAGIRIHLMRLFKVVS